MDINEARCLTHASFLAAGQAVGFTNEQRAPAHSAVVAHLSAIERAARELLAPVVEAMQDERNRPGLDEMFNLRGWHQDDRFHDIAKTWLDGVARAITCIETVCSESLEMLGSAPAQRPKAEFGFIVQAAAVTFEEANLVVGAGRSRAFVDFVAVITPQSARAASREALERRIERGLKSLSEDMDEEWEHQTGFQ